MRQDLAMAEQEEPQEINQETMENAQGLKLAVYRWEVPDPKVWCWLDVKLNRMLPLES